MRFATRAIHLSQESDPLTGAVTPPVYQTSTFEQEAPGVHAGYDYARTNNPTRARLEGALAALEGVEHCAVFASGLAAEHAVLTAFLAPGDEIVVPLDVYGGTYRLLHQVFQPRGVIVKQADFNDLDALQRATSEQTRLLWLESPSNPRLLIYDIAAAARVSHARGALLVVDNTFATPALQQPFILGADIVIHSVTKYLAGHSDLIQGAALAREAAIFEKIKFLQNAIGAVPGPQDCWLTLRGLKTLDLRIRRHVENAASIAAAVDGHPAVRRVNYPGLKSHPGHALARRQMSGFGAIVSLELAATGDEIREFVSQRRFFALAESLGGVRSLICHPAAMTHKTIPPEVRRQVGLSDELVRLSPGIEDSADLVEDLLEGLSRIAHGATVARESGWIGQKAVDTAQDRPVLTSTFR